MTNLHQTVFVSYASDDRELALKVCQSLRAADIEVWFDQNVLRGGDAWDSKIRRQNQVLRTGPGDHLQERLRSRRRLLSLGVETWSGSLLSHERDARVHIAGRH